MSQTEATSNYDHLDKMSVRELLVNMNSEDTSVPKAVARAMPQIEALVPEIVKQMEKGGRLFYIVDASECPPTFGVPQGWVIGIIAGGDGAIRKAVEFAEDNKEQGWKDLQEYQINHKDVVIGLAASGRTPYVIGAVEEAVNHGLDLPFEDGCLLEAALFGIGAASEQMSEGTSAFLEKRKPEFRS